MGKSLGNSSKFRKLNSEKENVSFLFMLLGKFCKVDEFSVGGFQIGLKCQLFKMT